MVKKQTCIFQLKKRTRRVPTNMKYLIFGVNGMAGHMIAMYLKEQGHSVTGFARSESKECKTIIGDALDKESVNNALFSEDFDIVVNCIGILNKGVDNDIVTGIYLNSVFPHLLVELLKETKIKVIHISTDCVFLGDKGCYKENSITDADSFYGKSKALGEIIDAKNLTIRTSIVGPELKHDGIGLFHWFMNQINYVYGYPNVIWSGVTTLQLAKTIEEVSSQSVTGLVHLVNNKTINKYELLCLFNKYCNNNKTVINQNDSFYSDKSLENTRLDFNYNVPSYEQMVIDMSNWIKSHKDVYAQYLNN